MRSQLTQINLPVSGDFEEINYAYIFIYIYSQHWHWRCRNLDLLLDIAVPTQFFSLWHIQCFSEFGGSNWVEKPSACRMCRSGTWKTLINVQSHAEGSKVWVIQLHNSAAVASKQDTRAPRGWPPPSQVDPTQWHWTSAAPCRIWPLTLDSRSRIWLFLFFLLYKVSSIRSNSTNSASYFLFTAPARELLLNAISSNKSERHNNSNSGSEDEAWLAKKPVL